MYNFDVIAFDTDSVFFKKQDESPFSLEEQKSLMEQLNEIMPNKVRWEMNGYFQKMITLATKNYITYDGKTIKYKGSALKDSKKEAAVKDFMKEIIKEIIEDTNNFTSVYHKYIKEAMNISDIKRWSSRKTITSKTFSSERANETKIKDALIDSEYVEGDKVCMFFTSDDKLKLAEKFDGDYNKERMIKKLYDASKVFNSILPEGTFLNYALKRNQKLLEEIK